MVIVAISVANSNSVAAAETGSDIINPIKTKTNVCVLSLFSCIVLFATCWNSYRDIFEVHQFFLQLDHLTT